MNYMPYQSQNYQNAFYSQPYQQQYQNYMNNSSQFIQKSQSYLQGKQVDNIEVVKAMDIPLDRYYFLLSID